MALCWEVDLVECHKDKLFNHNVHYINSHVGDEVPFLDFPAGFVVVLTYWFVLLFIPESKFKFLGIKLIRIIGEMSIAEASQDFLLFYWCVICVILEDNGLIVKEPSHFLQLGRIIITFKYQAAVRINRVFLFNVVCLPLDIQHEFEIHR